MPDDSLAILVVDREDIARRLALDLVGQPVQLRTVHDPATALLLIGRARPHVLVLGPVSGRIDAIALLEILREHEPQLPVIVAAGATDGMFTARVAALEPAAVIHHPYRPEQLLRLVQSFKPAGRDLTLAPLPIDLGRLRIEPSPPDVEIDGTRTTLPRREYLLLRYLAEREGTVVPRTEIAQAVWGATGEHTNNTLAVHVMRLRRRLDPQGLGPQWITAIRGIGYRLAVPSASEPGDRGVRLMTGSRRPK